MKKQKNSHPELFIGYPITQSVQASMDLIPKDKYVLFVGGGDLSLQEYRYGSNVYLGRKMPNLLHLADVQQIQKNVLSILKTLLPDFPFTSSQLVVVPYIALP